ncbi:MAG: hypothetical protein GY866_41315 [Proteobacteria bacterium]|nr:hypothetical protein [Pseudomonadota bacterium]
MGFPLDIRWHNGGGISVAARDGGADPVSISDGVFPGLEMRPRFLPLGIDRCESVNGGDRSTI